LLFSERKIEKNENEWFLLENTAHTSDPAAAKELFKER